MANARSLLLVIFVLLTLSSQLTAQQQPTSLIETVAGAERTGVPGTEFSFSVVAGLAADSAGNIYFTLQHMSRVYRLGVDGRVVAYAGNGVRGKNLDGVPALKSPLQGPAGLAIDATGNLLIACGNTLLRVDAASRVLSTVLAAPYQLTGSPNAIFSMNDIALGPDGILYLSDGHDFRIKSYSMATGEVTVLAGNGKLGPTEAGVDATLTPLKHPSAIAVAQNRAVYFSTSEPAVFRIRPDDGRLERLDIRLDPNSPPPDSYDIPRHLALDDSGHLFLAQPNRSRVLRMTLNSGQVSIYAGTGAKKFNGEGIAMASATVMPTHVATDSAGHLVIAELSRIRRIEAASNTITTVIGTGLPIDNKESTSALRSQLWEPANAIYAPDGNLYITSSFSNHLLRVNSNGELTTLAGGGNPALGPEPGPALQVALSYPQGIWVDDDGDIYFSDRDNNLVRRLSHQTGSVTSFATTPRNNMSAGVFLYYAAALIADSNYFYLSDPNGNRVWRISRGNGGVETYAGTGAPDHSVPSGDAKLAELSAPSGLALDSSGALYIAESGLMDRKDGLILRVDPATGKITIILSHLRQPSGLAFRTPNVLCFSETGAHQVGCFDMSSHALTTIAGTGTAGFSGDGGPAECAQLNRPLGISFDQEGNLYIADTGNQRIRRVRLGSSPAPCPTR